MSNGQQPAPGWYADPWPSPPDGLRWWDGGQWTSATSVPGQGPADAGWWRRAGAYLIDGFIVGSISFVVGIPAQVGLQRDLQVESEQLNEALAGRPRRHGAGGLLVRLRRRLVRPLALAHGAACPRRARLPPGPAPHPVGHGRQAGDAAAGGAGERRGPAVVVDARAAGADPVRAGLADPPRRPRHRVLRRARRSSASWCSRCSCSTTSGPRAPTGVRSTTWSPGRACSRTPEASGREGQSPLGHRLAQPGDGDRSDAVDRGELCGGVRRHLLERGDADLAQGPRRRSADGCAAAVCRSPAAPARAAPAARRRRRPRRAATAGSRSPATRSARAP